jgi:hypothetical protein
MHHAENEKQADILFVLCVQDLLEYRKKLRTLRVRMLDGTLKTLLVDDSQPVANLMVVICTKIGGYHSAFSCVVEFRIIFYPSILKRKT